MNMHKQGTTASLTAFRSPWLVIAVMLSLGGCASDGKLVSLPPTAWKRPADQTSNPVLSETAQRDATTRFQTTPEVPQATVAGASDNQGQPATLFSGPAVSVSADSLPLPLFINEIFGNQLKVSFQLAPELQQKNDLVTLRVTEPVKPDELFQMARQVLRAYGVALEKQGDLYIFTSSRGDTGGEPPILVTGEALPNVPISHRPVFQMVPLKVGSSNELAGWLKQTFEGQSRLSIQTDLYRNAIWLKGPIEYVRQAAEIIAILDQPLMRGRNSIRVEPLFLPADRLAARLNDVLTAEGYSVTLKGNSSIVLLPIQESNALLVFAQERSLLAHIKEWVEQLDKPAQQTESKGLYFYALRNTRAENMVAVLTGTAGVQAASAGAASGRSSSNDTSSSTGSAAAGSGGQFGGGQIVVDPVRNAIVFQGPADAWAQLLPIVRQMDVPSKQVLVEVLVAEVSLSDDFKFGIEWAINSATLGERLFTFDKKDDGSGGTVLDVAKGLTVGAGGLTYYPISSNGLTRAVLNALSQNSQVSILQAPRIMVRSGETASISVGTDIPIVTSTINIPGSGSGNSSGLVNQSNTEYRSTGISLSVTPVVYEGGRVDIQIEQEVSSAQATQKDQTNPTILRRSLNTQLSVNDGGSVLLGGLISNNQSNGRSKVPLLGDLPLIGHLFGSETRGNARTELLILVVPYVLNDNGEAESITKAFRESLELHDPAAPAPKGN